MATLSPDPPSPEKPKAVAFDFDGTLAAAPWPSYASPAADEVPAMCDLLRVLADTPVTVYVISGREESQRDPVVSWLRQHGLAYDELILRPDDDTPGPVAVATYKHTRLKEILKSHQVLLFADDRPDARRLAHQLGIPTVDPT
ncbi:MAG: hypothetical protein FWH11_12000 [Micrococcales bacterium]|nr:hypothetical protein [Micrococcales bacterium]